MTTSGFGPGFGIAAFGQKVHNNWIILDGAPLRTAIHGEVRMRPSVEALEEFQVEAGFYKADLGTRKRRADHFGDSPGIERVSRHRCSSFCATTCSTREISSRIRLSPKSRCGAIISGQW